MGEILKGLEECARVALNALERAAEDDLVDIGFSFLLQAALLRLMTDRERKLIVVGGPGDRTAFADAAPRSRKRNELWTYSSRVTKDW